MLEVNSRHVPQSTTPMELQRLLLAELRFTIGRCVFLGWLNHPRRQVALCCVFIVFCDLVSISRRVTQFSSIGSSRALSNKLLEFGIEHLYAANKNS